MKRATLLATLRKVHKMAASNNNMLVKSALAKLNEFRELGYPAGIRIRWFMCAILADAITATPILEIRSLILQIWDGAVPGRARAMAAHFGPDP